MYVARLRKLLAEGNGAPPTLDAFRNGYVLRVAPERIDLIRFQALVAAGEEELAAGRAAEASKQLAGALALWRGPALVDLTEEHGVRRETRRLEELRLRALEKRIDADLVLGRHADVVPELEALVAAEPYRERFAAQLMLALYRCGRQPDALSVYARLRTALHEEFALEPTHALRELERQILAQDPALEVRAPLPEAEGTRTTPRPRPLRRSALTAAVAALALVLIGGSSTVERGRAVASARPLALEGNSVVAIDDSTGAVLGETTIGGRPGGVATGLGSVWVTNVDDETLLRIDPRTRRVVDTIGLGVVPSGIAVGGGSVWIVSDPSKTVLEVDPAVKDVVATIELPGEPRLGAFFLVFARGSVWVRNGQWPGELIRIDPRTHAASVVRRDIRSIASDGRALWGVVGTYAYRVRRLDPPGEATRLDNLGGSDPAQSFVVAGAGNVWTASSGGTLWRIDPDTSRPFSPKTPPAPPWAEGSAKAPRSVPSNGGTRRTDRRRHRADEPDEACERRRPQGRSNDRDRRRHQRPGRARNAR